MAATLEEAPQLDGAKVGAGISGGSDLRPVVASGALRALVLPLSAVLNLVETAILVSAVGAGSYGAVLLVGTIFQLIPFADLGVGSAVTRSIAASRFPASDWYVGKVIRRSQRVLLASSATLIVVALLLGMLGAWAPILGLHNQISHAELVATLTIVLFACGLPLALGQRILMGAGKNHIAVAATVVNPVTAVVAAVVLRLLHAPSGAYVLIFPIAMVVTSATMNVIARRVTGINPPFWGPADARVMPVALPMFLMTVGLPLGLQSDKVILSHRIPEALSEYALSFQLYAPAFSVLSTAAFALLPVFTRRRAMGIAHRRLWFKATAGFGGLAVVAGAGFVVFAPLVVRIVASNRVHIGLDLRLAFAALLIVQISGLVSNMFLNKPNELAFQAGCVLNMTITNLGLSWILAGSIGVAGPVVASAIAMAVHMVLPGWLAAARVAR